MRKMKFKKRKSYLVFGIIVMLGITGCKKLVQVDEPKDSLTSAVVFSNDSLAQAAVNGLYIKILANTRFLFNGGMSLYPALSADELVRNFAVAGEDEISANAIIANNPLIHINIWKPAYAYIYQCNICIEGLNRSNTVSKELRDRLVGEVKFVRALCYYYLVNLYGDVPLALGTNADVNAMLFRTSMDEVYRQIEADLIAASAALTGVNENTTPTSYAAHALLARVYLHMKNWVKAEELSSAVINSGSFLLQIDLNNVFKKASKEIIFQWAPVQNRANAPEGFIFLPLGSTGRPFYIISRPLELAFEGDDLRKANWIKSGPFGYYPAKYKMYLSPMGTPAEEYNVVLRLAEQYLIRAESRANQNRIGDAVADINVIRNRAGLTALATTIGSEQCLRAIEHERQTELFTEWGHRWIDLKRTGRADEVLSVAKGSGWNHNDQLYPIPFTELETAPNLKQNPGYQ